jgi:hypothetical protein
VNEGGLSVSEMRAAGDDVVATGFTLLVRRLCAPRWRCGIADNVCEEVTGGRDMRINEAQRWKRKADGSALKLMDDGTVFWRKGSEGEWALVRMNATLEWAESYARRQHCKAIGAVEFYVQAQTNCNIPRLGRAAEIVMMVPPGFRLRGEAM